MKSTESYTSCMHVYVRFHIYTPQVVIRNKAVIQIHHGFGQHADRYEHFASYLSNRGYVVVVSDFVGHGQSLIDFEQGYFGQENGYENLVKDMYHLYDIMRLRYPDIPYFLMGEDLGSLLSRKFVTTYPDLVDGLILLGTITRLEYPYLQKAYLSLLKSLKGPLYRTTALFRKRQSLWNKKISLSEKRAAWFSSDEEERNLYLNDPMTHFPYTVAGQRDIVQMIEDVNSDHVIKDTQSYLSIYIGVGENDPVSQNMKQLIDKYKKRGLSDITNRVFSKRRHALLFEKNKNEIYEDILNWLNERTYV